MLLYAAAAAAAAAAGGAEGGRPRFEQPRAAAWLGLRAVLDLLRPAPMAAVLRDFPGLFAAAVKCLGSGDPQSSWAALACLHRLWEVLGGEVGRLLFSRPCSGSRLCGGSRTVTASLWQPLGQPRWRL